MNCEDFNYRLPEYLEDTLSSAEQAAAAEHVQKCGACRQTLMQQEAFAKSIRLAFDRETQRLSLRPETRLNILNALKRSDFPPTAWAKVPAFWKILWRHPAWAGAVFLCLVLLISGSRLYLDSAQHPVAQASVKKDRITYLIDVPIQTERHVYRRQNNMVVDAIVTEIGMIDGSFSENMRSSPSSQPHIQ